jgi:hypothetical protein
MVARMNAVTRKHAFEGLHNFRDFGGYQAGDRRMATGRFYRSANHALVSEADLERLAAMNIGVVVDLRRPVERERQPSRRWSDFRGVVIENHDPDEGGETWDVFMAEWDLTYESYRAYLLRYYERAPYLPRLIDLYSRYFEMLGQSDGAVVVHCAAGKDRTGLVVALTHALAGVQWAWSRSISKNRSTSSPGAMAASSATCARRWAWTPPGGRRSRSGCSSSGTLRRRRISSRRRPGPSRWPSGSCG